MDAEAFCPGHITSFFAIFADPKIPPERRGSRGSGFCIESGVMAAVRTKGPRAPASAGGRQGLPFRLEVVDNGTAIARPETTAAALQDLVRRAGRRATFPAAVRIENTYSLPIGAGFGVSGACALSAALAVNEAAGLGVDRNGCVAAAHCGEVVALSGLGDVGAQSLGGFEIRTREGPPPIGQILTPPSPAPDVVLVSYGPRRTREFLSGGVDRAKLTAAGLHCLAQLQEAPTLNHCVRLGRSFAQTLGLVSPSASALLQRVDPIGPASVAMLGDSVFAFGDTKELTPIARGAAPAAFFEATGVARQGARLL